MYSFTHSSIIGINLVLYRLFTNVWYTIRCNYQTKVESSSPLFSHIAPLCNFSLTIKTVIITCKIWNQFMHKHSHANVNCHIVIKWTDKCVLHKYYFIFIQLSQLSIQCAYVCVIWTNRQMILMLVTSDTFPRDSQMSQIHITHEITMCMYMCVYDNCLCVRLM